MQHVTGFGQKDDVICRYRGTEQILGDQHKQLWAGVKVEYTAIKGEGIMNVGGIRGLATARYRSMLPYLYICLTSSW